MRAILTATLVLPLLPFVAAAPASAHNQSCDLLNVVCLGQCFAHRLVAGHHCAVPSSPTLDAMATSRGAHAIRV